jgi:hypothetical protein
MANLQSSSQKIYTKCICCFVPIELYYKRHTAFRFWLDWLEIRKDPYYISNNKLSTVLIIQDVVSALQKADNIKMPPPIKIRENPLVKPGGAAKLKSKNIQRKEGFDT